MKICAVIFICMVAAFAYGQSAPGQGSETDKAGRETVMPERAVGPAPATVKPGELTEAQRVQIEKKNRQNEQNRSNRARKITASQRAAEERGARNTATPSPAHKPE